MNTLYLIMGLFGLGALLGMFLLALVLQKKETPKFVAFIHGAFVVAGLILLMAYSTREGPSPIESIVLFIIAALGGLALIIRDLRGRSLPKWLAVGHAVVAVGGFIYLLVFAFSR